MYSRKRTMSVVILAGTLLFHPAFFHPGSGQSSNPAVVAEKVIPVVALLNEDPVDVVIADDSNSTTVRPATVGAGDNENRQIPVVFQEQDVLPNLIGNPAEEQPASVIMALASALQTSINAPKSLQELINLVESATPASGSPTAQSPRRSPSQLHSVPSSPVTQQSLSSAACVAALASTSRSGSDSPSTNSLQKLNLVEDGGTLEPQSAADIVPITESPMTSVPLDPVMLKGLEPLVDAALVSTKSSRIKQSAQKIYCSYLYCYKFARNCKNKEHKKNKKHKRPNYCENLECPLLTSQCNDSTHKDESALLVSEHKEHTHKKVLSKLSKNRKKKSAPTAQGKKKHMVKNTEPKEKKEESQD